MTLSNLVRPILLVGSALAIAMPASARPNMSDVSGPNMSDITGPNMSDVTGPNMSDVTGHNTSEQTGSSNGEVNSISKMTPQQLADAIGETYAACGGGDCPELAPLLNQAAELLGE